MKIVELNSIRKPYFGYEDIARVRGISLDSAKTTASRYVRQGLLLRLKKNLYILREAWNAASKEDKFRLANLRQSPFYISLASALDYYEITTQMQRDFFESVASKRTMEIRIDGSASTPEVYRYYSMVLDELPDTRLHIAHFHETKRMASASILAALQAGITQFEATLGGLGGQPSNFMDDCPVKGTGDYYYDDPRYVGLVTLEDTLVQIDEMGIEHGFDVDRVLWIGKQMEKTVGRRLRSEAVINGRTLKEGHMKYARPGLKERKEKFGETPGQKIPSDWTEKAVLPKQLRAK